jgi:hypothetical protein
MLQLVAAAAVSCCSKIAARSCCRSVILRQCCSSWLLHNLYPAVHKRQDCSLLQPVAAAAAQFVSRCARGKIAACCSLLLLLLHNLYPAVHKRQDCSS